MTMLRWYLLIINIIAFFIYGIDKQSAQKGNRRVSEKFLISLAVIGGSVGAWIGMQVWRHKTRKPKFRLSIPIIFIIQSVALVLYRVM